MMRKKVEKTIREHGLIFPGARVLLALSGGSDSVCLLHVLNDLKEKFGFSLAAAHLNHGIRAEADSDCHFVQALCRELGVECFVKSLDIRKLAEGGNISEELCGREERYKFFYEISKKNNIDLIATAHNKNDVAETVLMHMLRGSGIDGMSGIAYRRGNIIRPLLEAEKPEIERYCFEHGYDFVVDKTNNETIYTRNKIRLELLPMLCKEFNPSLVRVIAKNSEIIRDDADFLNCEAKKLYKKIVYDGRAEVEKLKELAPAMVRRVIILMYREFSLSEKNLQSVYCESIIKLLSAGHSGSSVDLCAGVECAIETGKIFFRYKKDKTKEYEYMLKLDGRTEIPEAGMSITLTEWKGSGEKFFFESPEGICVRNRRRADVFYPVGMKGKKKLSDYFTDIKLPISERNKIPIVTYNDELVWIVGKRRDRRFSEGGSAYTFVIEKQGGTRIAEE